ncbi:acetyl-CoA carboxylase biotin carboxyl carrier protein [Micromonospora sp. WMMA1363]|uniref:acetyl-CoA carboxylase biotin carboxyl carrier protein n=1 Tax=Micromonospora sp. WMMA1363 TaxID=3053985 RepID=UPI00259CBA3B|nr:acetyl-CoA carboxylase biotin carboxyl carrier protein [Micromonospora sp. WMMA1363]MDM4718994.1 acetyl-CoA carboxylase biotin carboxyl carrier protein [Micromonospora sp. WMMA1363]
MASGTAGAVRPGGPQECGTPTAGHPGVGDESDAVQVGVREAVDDAVVHPAPDVVAGLCRQARALVADLDGPVRRVLLRSGDAVLEVQWHPPVESAWSTMPPAGPPPPVRPPAEAAATTAPVVAPPRHSVRSPIVGTFYRAPEPGAAPFVEVGDRVHPGQVVGIVEAMKLMNEVTVDRPGRVTEILADDGRPVEYDQPLLALDPA